mmetsp:Transcript_27900/g.33024  ORF Transcript_27900/g.33024 Transcript_27900/m.33024 type:complete len:95 (+) Transcript_27900:103-387(+)|eukprot:CAMPEP_0198266156 /NCGR_PEP_ID=MMETSP1447-20131203/26861_1 /TAXON_ID=420782 /ORGANISM="Chaetoceros dichaeta, Strain CCMP1751" /LENGTH=94 /DNA_ID=CAMNT_0043956071 /DNA_START=70 /DNA_END=354 /DNA_ORIENTATION=-
MDSSTITPITKVNEALTTTVANKDDINLDKNDTNNNNPSDKLREGPCAGVFSNIEECAKTKGVELRNYKAKLIACPNETDSLIKCMNKNPLHFH